MTKYINLNGIKYRFYTKNVDTNSNYNIGIYLYKNKDLICGTILKDTSTENDFIKWAMESIKRYNANNRTLL